MKKRPNDKEEVRELELIRDPTSIRLGLETRRRLAKALIALDATGMKASDFVRFAVIHLLDEMDATGIFHYEIRLPAPATNGDLTAPPPPDMPHERPRPSRGPAPAE